MSTLDVSLDLGNVGAFSVVSCHVTEAISALTQVVIEISSREDLELAELLHRDAVLVFLLDGFETRRWTLKVGTVAFVGAKGGSLRFRVELHPTLWLMRHTLSTRKFRNLSNQQIISTVLGEHHVTFDWRLTHDLEQRTYVVQYRESSLDFVLRLLEFEGIYYTFDEAGVMVLADRSSASPEVEGKHSFELIDSAGALTHGELGVHEITRGAQLASGAATVNDFDWKKSTVNLLSSQSADRDGDLEIYDYPTGYREPAQGALLAQLRLEALRVPARWFQGKGNVVGFGPARIFEFGGASGGDAFAGERLLVRVVHTFNNRAYMDGEAGELYENEFHAIPRDVPFRPAMVTTQPTVEGCHTAMVRGPSGEEIHTDKFGRWKAQFHWDREAKGTDEDSRWVRMLQETATSMTLARVGWEMHVAYIDGDPDRPVGIARNINGEMVPTYGQPAKKTMMTVKTQTYPSGGGGGYNELRLDDIAGAMRFDIKAQRDLVGLVNNDKSEHVGKDQTHTIDARLQHTVDRDQKRNVGANDITTVSGEVQLDVFQNRTKKVGGGESVKIDETQTANVDGNDTEKVGGSRITKSGQSIARISGALMTRTIGGSLTATAEGAIAIQAGRTYAETIGGSKVTVSEAGGILQTVSGVLTVNVKGEVMRQATGDMSVSAKKSKIKIGADAGMKSEKRFEMRSEVIHLEAKQKLTIQAGGLKFELEPDKITIAGPLKLTSGNTIRVSGNPDHLTK
ncbi:MAG: type VI secretion system tip protein TssI/VgrG [Byssovorax sp.]